MGNKDQFIFKVTILIRFTHLILPFSFIASLGWISGMELHAPAFIFLNLSD